MRTAYKMIQFRILSDGSIQHYCKDHIFTPGEVEPGVDPVPCKSGYHSCDNPEDCLRYHSSPDCCMWKVELMGVIKAHIDKNCSESIRLIHTMETNSGNGNSGYFNQGNHNHGNYNHDNYNRGDYNKGYSNMGYHNKGNGNLGSGNQGSFNLGDGNKGNGNLGNGNIGNGNIGDGKNSGN